MKIDVPDDSRNEVENEGYPAIGHAREDDDEVGNHRCRRRWEGRCRR